MAKLQTVQSLKKVLAEFASISGLCPNPPKNTFFYSGVFEGLKLRIGDCLQMSEGCFLMRYLGVPLIYHKLSFRDCELLIQKI